MSFITKELFLNTIFCPTYGWNTKSSKTEEYSIFEQFQMDQGSDIHDKARLLYLDAPIIKISDKIKAAEIVQKLIKDKSNEYILEATFIYQDFIARADIIERQRNKWKIIEIKSGVNIKPEYLQDLAYSSLIAKKAGLKIESCWGAFI